jgi:hypothetical protein
MAAGPEVVPLQLLLGDHSSSSSSSRGFLRWLLVTDAAASLAVLEARGDLEPTAVLRLLEGEYAAEAVQPCACMWVCFFDTCAACDQALLKQLLMVHVSSSGSILARSWLLVSSFDRSGCKSLPTPPQRLVWLFLEGEYAA